MLCPRLTVALLCLFIAGTASADTRLTVTVRDRTPSGAAVGDAVVCLDGLAPTRTSGAGTAVFNNVPAGSRVLAVWKNGYQVLRQPLLFNERTPASFNQIVLLQPGSGSAPCSPPPASTPVVIEGRALTAIRPDPPTITSVSINRGAPTVQLSDPVQLYLTMTGATPTEIRISETSPQFPESTAAWRPYTPSAGGYVNYPGGGFQNRQGAKTVYVQVRSGANASNVASDQITLVGPHVVSSTAAYAEAVRQGFTFRATPKGPLDSCVIVEDASLVAGSAFRTGGCVFTLFEGRQLKAGWTGSYRVDLPAGCGTTLLSPRGSSLKLLLDTSGLGCLVVISDLTLTGPVDAAWQQAFAR